MKTELELIDVIIRTKNSQEFLKQCLVSVIDEIPVRRIIVVDNGSTDKTIEIASAFDKVDLYLEPALNLGQLTKVGFMKARTDWVVVIDSDMILRKGWFDSMKKYVNESDAVECCEVTHYRFDIPVKCAMLRYGRLGQVLLRRDPVLHMELDLPFGEDAAISYNFEKNGMKWKKVEDYMGDHYPNIVGTTHRRTGMIFRPDPQVIHIPKDVQIKSGHIARKYGMATKKEVIKRLLLPPFYEAYWAFKKNFWFCLAYFKIR